MKLWWNTVVFWSKKVFVSGCYDMLHSGHVAFFKDVFINSGSGIMDFAAENFLGTGYPLQMGAAFVEARWYPKGVFRKFFLAPNVGGGAFRMNKNILHKFFGWAPDLDYRKPENSVQIGHNFMGGVTLGYVFTFPKNPHWSIEANWSFGRQWAKYESYSHKGDELVLHGKMGGSAEYMPFYRGGIFVAYKW